MKRFGLLYYYFTVILAAELILRIWSVTSFWSIGLAFILPGSFAGAGTLFLMTQGAAQLIAGNGKRQIGLLKWITAITTVFIVILYSGQAVYYSIFKTYFTVYSMLHGGQVMQFWREIADGFLKTAPVLAVLIFLPTALLLLMSKKKLLVPVDGRSCIKVFAAALLSVALFFGGVFACGRDSVSPYGALFMTDSLDESVRYFGVGAAMLIDGERLAFGFQPKTVTLPEESETSDGTGGEEETSQKELYGFNKMEIDFKALADAETDDTLKEMHRYFGQQVPTRKNEKTGIFKGKNLILITAESFSSFAIDRKYTPTLYKMQKEGFEFTNFYNPLWGVSTSDGEYTACLGLLPKAGVWSFRESSDNWLPFAMGNQFRRLGYKMLAYHNHYAEYYSRTESHPNMGYKYKGLGTGLKVKEQWPESDVEMIELSAPEFLTPDDNGQIPPFHVYYMTVSGHLRYNFSGQAMCAKHKSEVADLEMSQPCKAYIACQMELDQAMELLLEKLEEAGQLENTVIVLSGDHYPYGLEKENLDEFAGYVLDTEFGIYESSLIIYNPGTESEKVDKFCSSLDINPTVANLFGLEYDSRLLMGKDIFSDCPPLVVFNSRNWITDKAMYTAGTGEVLSLSEEPVSQAYVKNISNTVNNRFNYSKLILEQDYYRRVVPQW